MKIKDIMADEILHLACLKRQLRLSQCPKQFKTQCAPIWECIGEYNLAMPTAGGQLDERGQPFLKNKRTGDLVRVVFILWL